MSLLWLTLTLGWSQTLELATVLDSVERHAPKLHAMNAKLAEARGAELSARGAFDPVLTASATQVLTGTYERVEANSSLTATTPWGPSLQAGYRIGNGNFPGYYGEYETLSLGEVRVEIATPLLADLGMTAERAARLVANHQATAAENRRDDLRQRLYGQAASAFYQWVAAGEKRRLVGDLLQLAEARQVGLQRRVDEGALPPLDAIDNERVMWSRRA